MLKPPTPGLRRLHFDSNQPEKVSLVIPAGADLEVPEEIADQLTRNPHFKPAADQPDTEPEPEPDTEPETQARGRRRSSKAAE